MDIYEPRHKRKSRVRERQMARQSRRHVVGAAAQRARGWTANLPAVELPVTRRVGLALHDLLWHLSHSPQVLLALVALATAVIGIYAITHVSQGRIFPNVWALGVNIGDLTVPEAQAALLDAWNNRIQIALVDGDRAWSARPAQLGMRLDALKVAESARGVGMAGIPMGYSVPPIVSVDYTTAQNFFLDLTARTDVPPFNAGYEWRGGELVGVPGRDGRMLDVPQMMTYLTDNAATILQFGRMELLMTPLPPQAPDPEPYLKQARALFSRPFQITGYDPFTNEMYAWSTSPEVFASWLEVTPSGLGLRNDTFSAFVAAQTRSLNPDAERRYLDPLETKAKVTAAIQSGANSVMLRVRYRPSTYQVVRGDTGFRIARKVGLPYYLIEKANEGRDMGKLSIGDVINIPSLDATVPLDPVPNKRIVVNLDTQSLVAFQDGQPVFNWRISSGMRDYPTSPGIFQILSHNEIALGSSFTLCGSTGCGQWEMYWFMGMYEVMPGLMNGFHGAVLLPNGAYLGGGNVGTPYTFGCVMSQNDNAKLLYDWAELGTIVEVISSEYAPKSDLGLLAQQMTASNV